MWLEVLQCLLAIQLRADAPPEVVGSHAGKASLSHALLCFPVLCVAGHQCMYYFGLLWLVLYSSFFACLSVGPAAVELCRAYDHALGGDVCSRAAAQHCISHLGGERAVPAAVVLYSLLTQIWRKPVSILASPCCDLGFRAFCLPYLHLSWSHMHSRNSLHAGQSILPGSHLLSMTATAPAWVWVPPCRSACVAS